MIQSTVCMSTTGLLSLVDALARVDSDVSDGDRIDQLAALERVKGACAAAQAAVTVAFVTSQKREQGQRRRASRVGDGDGSGDSSAAADVARREHLGRGIAGQVALARRESPVRGSQHVKLALALVHELPNAYAALASGRLTEARAEIIARESAHLSGPARTAFDAELVVISRCDTVNGTDTDTDTDTDTGGGISGLGSLGDRELTRRARALAYRADPAAAQQRCEDAARARRVEVRRGADAMCRLTAHLPLAQAIVANAALAAAAETARALGDPRVRGQVMADTLVERVTGQATADAVPVEVQLVITDESLFEAGDVPAQVPGYGTVPAAWDRTFLHPDPPSQGPAHPRAEGHEYSYGDGFGYYGPPAPSHGFHTVDDESGGSGESAYRPPPTPRDHDRWATGNSPRHRTRDHGPRPVPGRWGRADANPGEDGEVDAAAERARVWLRRLYTHPTTGQLVGMDSTRRLFEGNLRRFLIARDGGTCRTPWCDAPIRHLDHIHDYAAGGPTTATNGQGLCARCNHTKNHPDWHTRTLTEHRDQSPIGYPHTTETTTPTGHTYRSSAPPLIPGVTPRQTPTTAGDFGSLHALQHPHGVAPGADCDTEADADLNTGGTGGTGSTGGTLSPFERHLTQRLRAADLRAG